MRSVFCRQPALKPCVLLQAFTIACFSFAVCVLLASLFFACVFLQAFFFVSLAWYKYKRFFSPKLFLFLFCCGFFFERVKLARLFRSLRFLQQKLFAFSAFFATRFFVLRFLQHYVAFFSFYIFAFFCENKITK